LKRDASLLHSLYFSPRYTKLARLVGYDGRTLDDMHNQVEPLGDRDSKEKVQAAAEELFDIEQASKPPMVRLKPRVRKLCCQLLGFRPDDRHLLDCPPAGSLPPGAPAPPAKPKPSAADPKREPSLQLLSES